MTIQKMIFSIFFVIFLSALPLEALARGVGTSSASFLKIQTYPYSTNVENSMNDILFVPWENWALRSHAFYWEEQLNAYIPETIRAKQMGDTWLALYDDESMPTLFNLNNTAGLGYEPQETRLDLGVGYSSFEYIKFTNSGSDYEGVTLWLNESIAMNAFFSVPSLGYIMKGGAQGSFQISDSIVVGGKYVYKSYLDNGQEAYRDCLWAISGATELPHVIEDDMTLSIGLSLEGNETLLDTQLLSGAADHGSSLKPIMLSQQTILQKKDTWVVTLVLKYLYEEISVLQSNDQLVYAENNALLIAPLGKYRVLNFENLKINTGISLTHMTNYSLEDNNTFFAGALGVGMEAWQWLVVTSEIGTIVSPYVTVFGDDNFNWSVGMEVSPWEMIAFRFGARNREITSWTAGIGLHLFDWLEADIYGYTWGDLGNVYGINIKSVF